MEINWKVVAPIALVVGVIVLYFIRVKPIEGLENADKEFSSKVKAALAEMEAWRKFADEEREKTVKKMDTEDYKEYLKNVVEASNTYVSTLKMKALYANLVERKKNDGDMKTIKEFTEYGEYARASLSALNGTDGQGSGMEATGAVDNSSGTSPSLW